MEILTTITLSKTPQITKKKNRSNEMVGVNASENSVAISDFCEEKKQANKNNNKIQLPDVTITSTSTFHALVRLIL